MESYKPSEWGAWEVMFILVIYGSRQLQVLALLVAENVLVRVNESRLEISCDPYLFPRYFTFF